LKADAECIEAALGDKDQVRGLSQLKLAVSDLEIKAAHAKKLASASASLGPRVRTSVVTKRDGKIIGGYQVAANPVTVAREVPPRFPFENLTSPAKRILPPGDVSMWLIKDGQEQQRRIVPIGADGEIQETITFDLQ
jgi:hypothetical protein